MLSARTISLSLLFLEALILVIPSFWGFWIAMGGLSEYFRPNRDMSLLDFTAYAMLLAGLCSFWRILFWVAANEQRQKKILHQRWWLIAFITCVLTLLTPVIPEKIQASALVWFVCGYLYLPTYLHLLFETKRLQGITCPIKVLKQCRQKNLIVE